MELKKRQRGGEIVKKERDDKQAYKDSNNKDLFDYYEGDWDNVLKMPQGKGKLGRYTGHWVNGKRQGQGIMTYNSSLIPYNPYILDIYYGNWDDDKRNGKGKLIRQYYEQNYKTYTIDQVNKDNFSDYGVEILKDGIWSNDNYVDDNPWKSDSDCENNAEIEDPTSLEQIPMGRGFRVEAEYVPDENKGRCYDAEHLIQIKNGITPLTRAPFTELDKTRMTAYVRSKTALPLGGKNKKSRKSRKSRKSKKSIKGKKVKKSKKSRKIKQSRKTKKSRK